MAWGLAAACSCLLWAAPAGAVTTVAYSSQWGGPGSGDGQFNGPSALATDALGNVYVTDTANHRVQKFNSAGTFISKWGTNGTGSGQFKSPQGIAASAAGDVYVTDFGNDRVQQFTADGTFVRAWGTTGSGNGQFVRPTGVATDASGNVYVVDYFTWRLQVFTSAGVFVRRWSRFGTPPPPFIWAPGGVAIDGDGNVLAADGNHGIVRKFDSTGTLLATFGNARYIDGVQGIDSGPLGTTFVAAGGNSGLHEFHPNGQYLGRVAAPGSGNGQVGQPVDVASNAAGDIYVADASNNRIEKFASKGTGLPDPPLLLDDVSVDRDDSVDDEDGCGGGPGPAADPCNTIQTGVDVVKDGGTVHVGASPDSYAESVIAFKPGVSLVGPHEGEAGFNWPVGSEKADVYGNTLDLGRPAITITATHVRVDGLAVSGDPGIVLEADAADIRNDQFAGNDGAGVDVGGKDHVIALNQFTGTRGDSYAGSIAVEDAANIQIRENLFGSQHGVPAINSRHGLSTITDVVIDSNVAFGNGGFRLGAIDTLDVTNNLLFNLEVAQGAGVADHGVGVLLDDVANATVSGNAIGFATAGIQLGDPEDGGGQGPVSNVLVSGNELISNGSESQQQSGGFVVTLHGHPNAVELTANRIAGNKAGIDVLDPADASAITAENNWWGCNAGPNTPDCDTVSPGVDADPWLVFSFEADPVTAPVPGSADLWADILENSDGDLPPEAEDFPPVAIELEQESGPGTLSDTEILAEAGIGNATIDSDEAGTASVLATFDFETLGATVEFSNAGPSSGSALPPAPSGGAPADHTAPALGKATLGPSRFAVDPLGVSERAMAAAVRLGTTFHYTLSEAATVKFTVERAVRGRKVGQRCKRRIAKNRGRRACTFYKRAGTFAVASKAGANDKQFSGKIGAKSLKPGRYRVTLVAKDKAGNRSKARRLSFKIIPR